MEVDDALGGQHAEERMGHEVVQQPVDMVLRRAIVSRNSASVTPLRLLQRGSRNVRNCRRHVRQLCKRRKAVFGRQLVFVVPVAEIHSSGRTISAADRQWSYHLDNGCSSRLKTSPGWRRNAPRVELGTRSFGRTRPRGFRSTVAPGSRNARTPETGTEIPSPRRRNVTAFMV